MNNATYLVGILWFYAIIIEFKFITIETSDHQVGFYWYFSRSAIESTWDILLQRFLIITLQSNTHVSAIFLERLRLLATLKYTKYADWWFSAMLFQIVYLRVEQIYFTF